MNTSVPSTKEQTDSQIEHSLREQDNLNEKLIGFQSELEENLSHTSEYQKLIEISNQLEELHESGAGELFWGEMFASEDELVAHIKDLRNKSNEFEESVEAVRINITNIELKIKESLYQVAHIQAKYQRQQEFEEEKKDYFEIHREVEKFIYRPVIMPWTSKKEDKKRFRRYILLAILYSILSALVIPMWQLPLSDKNAVVEIPERLTKFIQKKLKKQEPKPETKLQKKASASKSKATEKETKQARKKATQSGLLAFKNTFADLMDDASESKLGASARLSNKGSRAKSSARSIISSQVKSGSAGINTASLSREVGSAGNDIGAVKFSRVTSDIGVGAADDRPLTAGPGPSRTDEEIQIVFDKYKAALYRIYNRELRKNPTLQGKMVLRISIMPDGSVASCKVESTDLDSAVLSTKITQRVKRFNFGAKKDVKRITILYPIDFLPAS